jgi:hypothetical protein
VGWGRERAIGRDGSLAEADNRSVGSEEVRRESKRETRCRCPPPLYPYSSPNFSFFAISHPLVPFFPWPPFSLGGSCPPPPILLPALSLYPPRTPSETVPSNPPPSPSSLSPPAPSAAGRCTSPGTRTTPLPSPAAPTPPTPPPAVPGTVHPGIPAPGSHPTRRPHRLRRHCRRHCSSRGV